MLTRTRSLTLRSASGGMTTVTIGVVTDDLDTPTSVLEAMHERLAAVLRDAAITCGGEVLHECILTPLRSASPN